MTRVITLTLIGLLSISCGGSGSDDVPSIEGPRMVETPMKFTIHLPTGWERFPGSGAGFHYVSPLEGDETPDFQENIGFVRVDAAPADADAEWVMEQALAPLPADGLAVVKDYKYTFFADGHRVLCRKVHRDSLERSYLQYYVVPKPGLAIRITGTTPDVTLDKYGPIFDGIVTSMRFKK